jgi:xylan 1,4-beta-xylosidase
MNCEFICDANANPSHFEHFWEHTVGSGHATLALRADWQKQLTRCHQELGFKYVRFHGILSDDMGTLNCQSDQLVYSFYNANTIFDFLLSIGMRPFVELSFMPYTLSSGGDIVFHYKSNVTPPKDYAMWGELIHKIVINWVERYGIDEVCQWFFEVWNEPNLKAFWTGTQLNYFELFKTTSNEIKKINTHLRVGGPATANNGWIPSFIDYCQKNQVSLDFISTHHYPTDAFGKPGDDTEAQLAASERSVLQKQALQGKKESKTLPLYYTEWSTSSNPFDDLHDMPYAAAFIVKTIMEARGIVEAYSYWIFSDIFEENYFSSKPFHGGFGLLNIYGIPKPAYRAYELLHHLGDLELKTEGKHPTVDVWATKNSRSSTLKIICTNWALPRHEIKLERVSIKFKNFKMKSAFLERIDTDHANPRKLWLEWGSPDYLSQTQTEELELRSAFKKETVFSKESEGYEIIEFDLPPQGTASLTVECQ